MPTGKYSRVPRRGDQPKENAPQPNREVQRIRQWLRQVHFRHVLFGGVSEADVWKKLGELNSMYESLLTAERVRCDALIQERAQAAAARIVQEHDYAQQERTHYGGNE